nr:gluconokinase [uncultured Gellertiella sp.]
MTTPESNPRHDLPCRMVLMGVSGCGKSSVGEAFAMRTGAVYCEGDKLHPLENIAKMSAGLPLEDEDRWPWFARVADILCKAERPVIVGCSALKRIYRDRIRQQAGDDVVFIHLHGSRVVIEGRMGARQGHFMPTSLLDSQFATLQPPGADELSVTVDIDQPLDAILADILRGLDQIRVLR